MKYTIVIVDDHHLVARAFTGLIEKHPAYSVMYEASSGVELIRNFKLKRIPDIVLLDTNMPEMDGFQTALWLKNNYPEVKILALSMNDKEEAIVNMIRNGACGYLLKGCSPAELKLALDLIVERGFYYSEFVTDKLVRNLNTAPPADPIQALGLNSREIEFVKLACSDLTYQQIADKMCVATRTVDGYRESVFLKMNVKSRVGMVIYALKHHIMEL